MGVLSVLASFMSLWPKAWENQLKEGKIYFRLQFQRFQSMSAGSAVCGLWWSRTSWWSSVVKQSSSSHGSQEVETDKKQSGVPCKGTSPVTSFLQPGPTSDFPPPPNKAIKLWIHQWSNSLIRPETSWSTYVSVIESTSWGKSFNPKAFWGILHMQTKTLSKSISSSMCANHLWFC
jgi:hypothetical protein